MASKTYCLKNAAKQSKINFFRDKLRTERNRVTAIRKNLRSFLLLSSETDKYNYLRPQCNKDYALYKQNFLVDKILFELIL